MKNQKGFTLVEIAIVLVIIGLLLGGVLKGQELISNAKIKSTQQNIQELSAALYAYKDKTGYLPGDDPTATNNPGDGDGTIDANERQPIYQHLVNKGLIAGNYDGTTYLQHSFDDVVIIDEDGQIPGVCARFDGLPQDVAEQLDRKLDDGVANTGSVQVNGNGTSYTTNNDVLFKIYWLTLFEP